MNNMLLRLVFPVVLAVSMLSGPVPITGPSWLQAAEESWKKEFDDICSKTEDPLSLQPAELKQLIERCDALRPSIERLDETQRKIYLKKLQMCRDLFTFALPAK